MRFTLLSFVSGALALSLASLPMMACGGTTSDGGQPTADGDAGTGTRDTGTTFDAASMVDSNVPDTSQPTSNVYPAVKALPIVEDNGGGILANPKIVTVTFTDDPFEERLQAFGDQITTTAWWDAVTAGYCTGGTCIGKGSSGGHVVIPTAAAASYTDVQGGENNSTIQTLIKDQVAAGTFPAPDADTLYAIYFPQGVSVTLDNGGQTGKSCVGGGFGGYHQSTTATAPGGKATRVAYAIIPRCSKQEGETTNAASHEIIEAATDPYVDQGLGYYMQQEQSWPFLYQGGEVADLCVDYFNKYSVQESGFTVQRSWSNGAAKAGHDPCVPAPAGVPYFNVAPKSDAVQVTLNKPTVIEATAFSDAPLDPWNVDVADLSQFGSNLDPVTVSIDQSQVSNGNKVNITVTLATKGGVGGFVITSKNSSGTHIWPVLVGD